MMTKMGLSPGTGQTRIPRLAELNELLQTRKDTVAETPNRRARLPFRTFANNILKFRPFSS
jgi:hypothetical protein